jgi:hypothetical protein
MDIVLRTNASDPSLELKNCRPRGFDCFECALVVQSLPFRAEQSFWFDRFTLEQAAVVLDEMNRTLKGNFRLKLQYEDPYISFGGDGRGHIEVSGLLVQTGPRFQRLEWEFQTDQTCLSTLIADVRKLLSMSTAP